MSHPCVCAVMALAGELGLPEPVLFPLERAAASLPWEKLPVCRLSAPDTAGAAWAEAEALLPRWTEDGGMAHLALTLAAAERTRTLYRRLGLPEEVYSATMGCIPRFLAETRVLLGRWAYDRGFWTWRQTGGLLLRLGTLEFEMNLLAGACPPGLEPGDPVLSVHIPSDAVLSRAELDRSYALAGEVFSRGTVCPWGPPRAVLCGSWLLSPALDRLLPAQSGIRRFAGDYRRFFVDERDRSFFRWLFRVPDSASELPEETSLQRRAKAYLDRGGKIGMAKGILHGDKLPVCRGPFKT